MSITSKAEFRPEEVAGCLCFTFEAIKTSTNNFDQRPLFQGGCKLGEGGFGPVFRGKLKFTDVAIKIMRSTPKGDQEAATLTFEHFIAEVKCLTRFRHPNLVTLIGFSSYQGWKCLIYEFLPNGTLDDVLEIGYSKQSSGNDFKKTKESIRIPWMCRMSIAVGIARGLAYLHTADEEHPLVHRDVKSANVLLDLSFRAKVGGFGFARSLENPSEDGRTARVVGTSGYISPECYNGRITTKMDAFSYGVILLEMISGLAPYDPQRTPKDLISYMEADMEDYRPNILSTKVDEHAGDWPSSSFLQLFRIAKQFVEPKFNKRSEIKEMFPKLEELVTHSAEKYAEQLKFL